LLDLNLPKLSGHEVLAYVKGHAEFQKIPVLVLSTSRAPADIQKAYALAANCYICKPSTLDEFRHLIKTLQEFWLELVRFPTGVTIVPARSAIG
jgi:chemotaxis family two-component system response regulator Rcp1